LADPSRTTKRRRLRAVYAADVVNYGGLIAADETRTIDELRRTRRIACDALHANGGWLFGMPGDGIFALFESAVDAVRCALVTQAGLAATSASSKMQLRIGVHLGEVLFQDDQPFGEALVIAARLESLADPGGILVSEAVMQTVAARIAATFEPCGTKSLKHIPRQIATFSVRATASFVDVQPVSISSQASGAPAAKPGLSDTALGKSRRALEKTGRVSLPEGRSLDPTGAQNAGHGRRKPEVSSTLERTRRGLGATNLGSKPKTTASDKPERRLEKTGRVPSELNRTLSGPRGRLTETIARPLGEDASQDSTGTANIAPRAGAGHSSSTPETYASWRRNAQDRGPKLDRSRSLSRQFASDESRNELTRALATYLGPVARVLVKRQAATAASLADLIDRLAAEIPAARDRNKFLAQARLLQRRPNS
jgi:class 3 adenylate cyclase